MWQGLRSMRFPLGSSLSALLLAVYTVAGHGRQAVLVATEPVNLHAANAARSADVAEQAAKVATRVAAHTEDVAHDTAAALRYTRDALKQANANEQDIAEVSTEAETLEREAGVASGEAEFEKSRRRNGESEDSSMSSSEESAGSSRNGGRNGGSNGGSYEHGGAGGGAGGAGGEGSAERNLDVNGEIAPYPNGVEPFGQEEPAQELTKESVKQSDGMIDKIENAQSMEAKRSVYRALTKLRGATIASYDGMAKEHLKNVDNYNKKHSWREDHPFKHLAEEEADTHIWAFPKKTIKASKKNADAVKPVYSAGPAPAAAA